MLALTLIDGTPIILDETKIYIAYKSEGKVFVTMSNGFNSEQKFTLKGECWDVMQQANSSKTEYKENKPYNYYLGYIENGAMYVAHYIGFYDSDKKFPKDFDYKSGFITPLADIFCVNPQLPAVFVLTTPFNRSLVGRSLLSGEMLDYDVTCINGFYKEPDGSLMVDGQKII